MRTPRYHSVTLAAAALATITNYGRYIHIMSISASTVALGIDDDPPQVVCAGMRIDCEDRKYTRIRLVDVGGAGATVVIYLSDAPVTLLDSAIAVALANIDNDLEILKPATTLTLVNRTVVAQTGVGVTQILAANAARKWCLVTADLANANYVFLGVSNAVTEAVGSFFDMMAGGSWREHYTGAVWACSTNGTEQVRAYEST